MYFQKVLKGIPNLSKSEVEAMVWQNGIFCNWWRKKGTIMAAEIKSELTESNLLHHLNDYDKPLPTGHPWSAYGSTYGEVSAFISTTAGVVERDNYKKRNIVFAPFMTAIRFATESFKTDGWLFYAYVMTLGKKSVELQGFSEEIRELNIYTQYLRYHHEGEIAAKISIPSVAIEKAEQYSGPPVLAALRAGQKPTPVDTVDNASYLGPEKYCNIRELLNP